MVRDDVQINESNLLTQRQERFSEQVRKNFVDLAEFFEQDGSLQAPIRDVLRKGFLISPTRNLIHSYHSPGSENNPANIGLSRVGQASNVLGDHTQLHEGAHGFAHKKEGATIEEILFSDETRAEERHLYVYRSGFHHRVVPKDKDETHHYFSALNEALTDSIPIEIIKTRNWSLIYQHFLYVYPRERNMLATIVSSLARETSHEGGVEEREGDVFRLFVKSYVLGWQPALKRELLNVFGPNALRVLAIINAPGYVKRQADAITLYPKKWWKLWERHYYNDALIFFDTSKSILERESAAQRILPREGPMHYIERRTEPL